MITPPGEILTPRLMLRKPVPGDAPDMFNTCARDPDVMRYLMRVPQGSLKEVQEFLEQTLADWESGRAFAWSILLSRDLTFLGMIEARVDAYMVSISYLIARAHWNRGFATESVSALCAWADAEPEVFRVWAVCAVDNKASARVLEKAGMIREGILRRWAVFPNVSGSPGDCYSYARVKESAPPLASPFAHLPGPATL